MISDAAKEELKLRNPCDVLARRWVRLRKHGKKMIGPCPLHSPDSNARDSTCFECDAEGWVCAVCADGGDVFKLLMLHDKIDFPAAIDQLGGVSEPDPQRARQLEGERATRRAASERDNNVFRERERETVYEIWKRGIAYEGTSVADYLRRRGLVELPPLLKLRCIEDMPYYATGKRDAEVVHRGPCMLAPIVDLDGKFRALHMTWLDLDRPNGKAAIRHPETGDELPAKKVRGSKAGNAIRLAHMLEKPERLYIGEGIETVLSVWFALHKIDAMSVRAPAFWSAVDLGNLGGRASETVPHPSLKRGDRAMPVPGPEPDLTAPGLPLPEWVKEVVLLGDGDSDRYSTHCTLMRAQKRFARHGATVRCAWAPDGKDFNDLLMRAAA